LHQVYHNGENQSTQKEARTFTKRVGSTNYKVAVYFSRTSKETMNDKIMRLVKNEAHRKAVGE